MITAMIKCALLGFHLDDGVSSVHSLFLIHHHLQQLLIVVDNVRVVPITIVVVMLAHLLHVPTIHHNYISSVQQSRCMAAPNTLPGAYFR
jgi:hypothetical protein